MAEQRLVELEADWGKKYPVIGPAWRYAWKEVPSFAYRPRPAGWSTPPTRSTACIGGLSLN
jgi:transposase-like protein